MRIILFKNSIESLNHFVNELNIQFTLMGHETLVADICRLNAEEIMEFCKQKVDAAVCFDGFSALDKNICDSMDIPWVSIYVDHPMSFSSNFVDLPSKHLLIFNDENHVEYMKRFYHVQNAFFFPHMASLSVDFADIPLEKKDIPVFFSARYRDVNSIYQEINERFGNSKLNQVVMQVLEYLLENPSVTIEAAMESCLLDNHMQVSDEMIAYVLQHTKLVDHFVRMFYRNKVVGTVVKAGIPITLMGGGWDKVAYTSAKNVTILESRNFAEVFPYMERSRITLNVMPWFKAGTHDRVFNALLHNSCPLSDESTWFIQNMLPDKECAYYSLNHLEELPGKIYRLLNDDEMCNGIIANGKLKVESNYTSKNVAEYIIKMVQELFGEKK